MNPRIAKLNTTKLIGKRLLMSFANNRTRALWQSFMPHRAAIKDQAGPELYSVVIYPDISFFEPFDPAKTFEKWAAIQVSDLIDVPEGMDTLLIPEGLYAVFHYRGRPSEAQTVYHYIFSTWMPKSDYTLDDRPHFALMGEKYMGENPESEEEFWVPVREKD